MARSLNSWSWKEIQQAMKYYNGRLQECKGIAMRLNISLPLQSEMDKLSEMQPDRAEVVSRLFFETKGITTHVDLLNREIKRRNALIGVL